MASTHKPHSISVSAAKSHELHIRCFSARESESSPTGPRAPALARCRPRGEAGVQRHDGMTYACISHQSSDPLDAASRDTPVPPAPRRSGAAEPPAAAGAEFPAPDAKAPAAAGAAALPANRASISACMRTTCPFSTGGGTRRVH